MKSLYIGTLFVLFCTRCNASSPDCTNMHRFELVDYLFDNKKYKANMPPNFNSDDPLKVSVQISMYDVGNLRDETMAYDSTMYIRLKWVDTRLQYHSCAQYERLTVSGVDVPRCWIPDLYFHHEREANYHDVFRTNELIYIGRNGSVTFSARLTLTSRCFLNLEYYPYDTQKCDIVVQSYASAADEILLEWSEDVPFKVKDSKEFSVIDDSITSIFESPYANPLGNYSTLHANLRFQRLPKAYEVMYIAPPIVFFLLALFSFLLNHWDTDDNNIDLVARMTTSVGALTSTVMLWAGIYSKLPPVPALSKLDWWMMAHIILIGIITILHSVIHVTHKCFDNLGKKCFSVITVICVGVLLISYIVFACRFTKDWKDDGKEA